MAPRLNQNQPTNQPKKQVAEELEKREAARRVQEEEKERQREAARAAALAREEELRKLTSQWAQEPKEEGACVCALGFSGWMLLVLSLCAWHRLYPCSKQR